MRRLLALTAAGLATGTGLIISGSASAHDDTVRATLRDPRGTTVGSVIFTDRGRSTEVAVSLRKNRYVTRGAFHGLHIHANNSPDGGRNCIADPAADPTTWFVSADGHLSEPGQTHGLHNGDLSSPLVQADGTAKLTFSTDRIDPQDLRGKAVVLHANADNFGNVPVGTGAEQYTANTAAAGEKTAKTGNAGNRVACGVLHR